MMKIGLTGGIGSGKSTIAALFEELGIPVYYADTEAKRLMNHSTSLKNEIIALLGAKSYLDDRLNRKYIADIVFEHPEKLAALNKIVHPAVAKHFKKWAAEKETPYVIQENAIIFETGAQQRFDHIIMVSAPQKLRIKRVMKRDKISELEVKKRIKNQWPEYKKLEAANFFIKNIELSAAQRKVKKIHAKLIALKN